MENRIARPIFVVGSPRSGTSILTWALGQHPNILPTEEAPGRGPFAVAVGAHFASGGRRGARSHLSALGVARAEFFRAFGDAIDRLVLDHRHVLEHLNRASAIANPSQVSEHFAVSRGEREPKRRWVDGTPESSFYICGLNLLFPEAKFVHILRDVREVAASMLGFRQDDGSPLVRNADEACDYWLRATRACELARRALGPNKVHRLLYADLVARPQAALRAVCGFLGEDFAPACLEPLSERINSSHVENPDALAAASMTPGIAEALAFSDRLCGTQPVDSDDAGAGAEFEAQFERMIEHMRNIDGYHNVAKSILDDIAQALQSDGDITQFPRIVAARSASLAHSRRVANACGIVLAVQWAASLAIWICTRAAATAVALGIATAAIGIYLWLRRAGLRAVWRRLLGTNETEAKEPQ